MTETHYRKLSIPSIAGRRVLADGAPSLLLHRELLWMVHLRWLAGVAILSVAVAAPALELWPGRSSVLVGVGIATLAYNIPMWLGLRRWRARPGEKRTLHAFALGQIILDTSVLIVLANDSGGASSPVLFLFALHMIFASLMLRSPAYAPYLMVCASMAAFMLALGVTGHWPDEANESRLLLAWSVSLVLVTYLTTHIARLLHNQHAALYRKHAETHSIIETVAAGVITTDANGIIATANTCASALFDMSMADLVGREFNSLLEEPVRLDDETCTPRSELWEAYTKSCVQQQEVVGRCMDGTRIQMGMTVNPVIADGAHMYTIALLDITESKRVEDELRSLNHQLERQQRLLAHGEKMTALGQMAAGIAHEIANPLANMDSLLQRAERKSEALSSESGEVLREQIRRITEIVAQMTAFAHPKDSGWEVCTLNEVVEGAFGLVGYDKRMQRIDVGFDFSDEMEEAPLIRGGLQQVFVNIIVNALDALADVSNPSLRVRTDQLGDTIVAEISDNGPGIAPEHVGHLFEPFFTTKDPGHGTGLGLSISYSIVQRHGGSIEGISNAPEPGMTFRITIPIDRNRDGAVE